MRLYAASTGCLNFTMQSCCQSGIEAISLSVCGSSLEFQYAVVFLPPLSVSFPHATNAMIECGENKINDKQKSVTDNTAVGIFSFKQD